MANQLLLILAAVLCGGQFFAGAVSVDSAECYSDEVKKTVSCQNLEEFPQNISANTKELYIRRSRFLRLKKSDFDNISNLSYLQITQSNLTWIDADALDDLHVLEKLYLQDCQLTSLHEGQFSRVGSSLLELDLTNNSLNAINSSVLNELESLETLNLEGNNWDVIPDDIFAAVPSLIRLGLAVNQITYITPEMFNGIPRLKLLGLSYNLLERIDDQSFVAISQVELLFLGNNKITTLSQEAFSGLTKLRLLNLENNKLIEVPSATLSHLPHLEEIVLSGNYISNIKNKAFIDHKYLERIQINSMPTLVSLHSEAFVNLPNLTLLQITNNTNLFSVAEDVLGPGDVPQLKYLYMFGNNFQSMNESMFLDMVSLETVYVHENPWHCDCQSSWMRSIMDHGDQYTWVNTWRSGPEAVICRTPRNLEEIPLYQLSEQDLTCDPPEVSGSPQSSHDLQGNEEFVILEAILDRGIPGSYWTTPGGAEIHAGNVTNTSQGTFHADQTILTNHSVLAWLNITDLTPDVGGAYTLTAFNAGGRTRIDFDVLPTRGRHRDEGGMSQLEWVTCFLCAAVGLVIGAVLVFADKSRRQAEREREEEGVQDTNQGLLGSYQSDNTGR